MVKMKLQISVALFAQLYPFVVLFINSAQKMYKTGESSV